MARDPVSRPRAGPAPGELSLLVGPMFSGKTGRLIDLLEAADRDGRRVVTVKPIIEDRYSTTNVVSHDGRQRSAVGVISPRELRDVLVGAPLAGIDEAQFLEAEAVEVIAAALAAGTDIIATALDLDFRGEPFAATALLVGHAKTVDRLVATCGVCGAPATHTQRLVDGVPAPLEGPTVLIGGPERYAPRCPRCFWAERSDLAQTSRLTVGSSELAKEPPERLRDIP